MFDALPEGWIASRIGDLFSVNSPGHWGEDPVNDGNVLVLRSTNFRKSGGLEYSTAAPRVFDTKKLTQKRLLQGDIILERSGGSPAQAVGRVNRFDADGVFSVSNFMQILRPAHGVDSEFAYYLLDSFYADGGTDNLQKATTGIRNLDFKTYMDTAIRLPSYDEQRRIAEVLRSVDETIAKYVDVLSNLKDVQRTSLQAFLQSGQTAALSKPIIDWTTGRIDRVTKLPGDWSIVRLIDVAKLESGHTPSRRVPAYWENGHIDWISLHDTKNLERAEITSTAMKITADGLKNSSARLLPKGTVCFSRTATVGKCVIMGHSMATSQDFANFICSEKLNNRYLMHLLRWMQPIWKQLSSGSTHKTIYMPTFQSLQIVLPTRAAQDEIVQAMDSLTSAIEENTEAHALHIKIKRTLAADLLSGWVRVP